jgi:hypothetical protein
MVEEIEENRDKTAKDLFFNENINHKKVSYSAIKEFLINKGLMAR